MTASNGWLEPGGALLSIEWMSLSKLIPAGSSAAKSIYDRVIGKSPRLNFDTGSDGIELHVFNTRDETIIIERIEAYPNILGFSEGRETIDVVRAAVAQIRGPIGRPIAVLSPTGKAEIRVLKARVEESSPDQIIRVTAFWRTARRRAFSRSSVTTKIAVQDIKDLMIEVDRKQPRMFSV
jgi:hypothetical protein